MTRRFHSTFILLTLVARVSLQSQETQVTVQMDRPGPAISHYLYGQFIEHLGRCIHDGIWAEKLRDRKFLLAPTNSPWKLVNPEGATIEMFHDPSGAYAGDHCLALWRREAKGGPAGISQGDLGLVAGQDYAGYAILANANASGAPVEIRLAWGPGPHDHQNVRLDSVGREYRKFPFRFRAGVTTDAASLSVLLSQPAHLWIAGLSLMPADNVKGMRRDTLELIKRLNPPITRWPGGNFVSGYNWKDAIGDRDRRPPRWERAWNDVEDNDFGLDEFMTFCALVRTEPYIAVNTGLGRVEDAADEVEYATGSTRTRWGAERARNGHAKPYAVQWWGVGNEMYGDWQLGNVSVERYAIRHEAFVAAMRARQPSIKIIAVGAFEHYYTLGDANAAGRALHELLRSVDVVVMANWAQTVNVIGSIKTSRNFACLDPAGHLLALYRAQVNGQQVPVTVNGPGTVDVVAAWDKASNALSLGLIDYSPKADAAVVVHLPGTTRFTSSKAWRITDSALGATNIPGQPEAVTTVEISRGFALDQSLPLPKHSITVLRLEGKSR